ncbi:CBASS cGAMP-activated phospholipase [Acidocella facilis]|uniref:CBASS cGAMP-activated phospholipase n=1 Tax=Acidocella facilis TaxID=525 RepID=UPI001F1A5200|nr:CBASS cGAMP-activated phospholipase [Acidocella facilis]
MTFQILCLSGGGFLGLHAAAIVTQLEAEFGAPLASHFDLLAGTSIGGIIALGLANEIPAQKIQSGFEQHGTKIFSDRPRPKSGIGRKRDVFRALFSAKYSDAPLREAVGEILGEDTLIGHLKHPCIIPAVNLSKGGPQVFKTDHHEDFRRDFRLSAIDVAMATSAAPTYFPLAQVGDALYADGGLYANSPDLLALHEAEHFFKVNLNEIRLLSIGTSTAKFSFSHEHHRNLGMLDWADGARLVQTMISSQQQLADYMLRHKLVDNYIRLDTQQSKDQQDSLSLDTATLNAQQTIKALATSTAQSALNNPKLREILAWRSPAPHFFYRQTLEH